MVCQQWHDVCFTDQQSRAAGRNISRNGLSGNVGVVNFEARQQAHKIPVTEGESHLSVTESSTRNIINGFEESSSEQGDAVPEKLLSQVVTFWSG
jgi:hypothetical protein